MSGSCHSEVYGRKIGKRTRGKGSKKDSIDRATKNDQLATKTTYPWPALNGATLMERPAHRRRIFRDTFSLLFAILSFVHPPPNKVFLPAKRILSCSRLTTVLRIGLPHREYPIPPSVSPWIEAVFSFLFFHEPTKWHYVAKPWIRKNCYCRDKFTFFFFLIYRCPPATIYWPPFPLFRPCDLCLLSPSIFISRVWSRKRWSHTGIGDTIPHEQAYVDRKYLIADRLEHASKTEGSRKPRTIIWWPGRRKKKKIKRAVFHPFKLGGTSKKHGTTPVGRDREQTA